MSVIRLSWHGLTICVILSGSYIIEVFHARTGKPVAQSSAEIREIQRMMCSADQSGRG